MANDFLPMGLSPYPSQQAYLLMNTPVGRVLLDSAREALSTRYNMQPVGGEAKQALIDRTALLFVQQFGDKWQGATDVNGVDGDELQTIVNFVSPLSDHKSATEILAGGQGISTKTILIGAAVVAGVIALAYLLGGKKKPGLSSVEKKEIPIHLGEGI